MRGGAALKMAWCNVWCLLRVFVAFGRAMSDRRTVLTDSAVDSISALKKKKRRDALRDVMLTTWPEWRRSLNVFVRTNPYFEFVIFALIGLNCVTISLDNVSQSAKMRDVIEYMEDTFTLLFVAEAVLKIIGRGVFNRFGYFTTKSNIFDFLIVVISFYELLQTRAFPQFTVIPAYSTTSARSARLLRPLRTLSVLAPLRIVLDAISASMVRLAHVLLLSFVFVVTVGLVALQFFRGAFHQRCSGDLDASVCRTGMPNVTAGTDVTFASLPNSVYNGYMCRYGVQCVGGVENPGDGFTSFDSIFPTGTTLIAALTLDDWAAMMYDLVAAEGLLAQLYFVFVVLVGTLFVVNLILATLADGFTRTLQAMKAQRRHERKAAQQTLQVNSVVLGTQSTVFAEPPNWVSESFRTIASNKVFRGIGYALTVANTAILASVHHGMSDDVFRTLTLITLGFAFVFLAEGAVRMVAFGPRGFVKDPLNPFDLVLTLAAIAEYFVAGTASFNALRAVRLARLLEVSLSMKRTLAMLQTSITRCLPMLLLLFLTVFLFALLGVQLFAGKLCGSGSDSALRVNTTVCDDVIPNNFDNVAYAALTVFAIIVGDAWHESMTAAMAATSEPAALYFLACVIIGTYMVVNLLMAVLINAAIEHRGADRDKKHRRRRARQRKKLGLRPEATADAPLLSPTDDADHHSDSAWSDVGSDVSSAPSSDNDAATARKAPLDTHVDESEATALLNMNSDSELVEMADKRPGAEDSNGSGGGSTRGSFAKGSFTNAPSAGPGSFAKGRSSKGSFATGSAVVPVPDPPPRNATAKHATIAAPPAADATDGFDVVFGDGTHDEDIIEALLTNTDVETLRRQEQHEASKGPLRRLCRIIVNSRIFNLLMILTIVFSVGTLCMMSPTRPPDSRVNDILGYTDVACGGVFLVEVLLKMAWLGPYHGATHLVGKGYLQYPWNVFDLVMTVTAIVPAVLVFVPNEYAEIAVGWLRVFRVVRPWSLVGRNRLLMLVFRSLASAVRALRNVVVLTVLVWFTYSVLGVQLFRGSFYACSTSAAAEWGSETYYGARLTSRSACLAANYSWVNSRRNFDNVAEAMLTMFGVVTTDAWQDVAYLTMAAVNPEDAPVAMHSPAMAFFTVTYIVVATLLMLNLFVAVLVDSFFVTRKKVEAALRNSLRHHNKQEFLTDAQQDYVDMYRRALVFVKPPLLPPYGPKSWRNLVRRLVRQKAFEVVYIAAVIASIVVQATAFAAQPPIYDELLVLIDAGFTAGFCFVTLMKIIGYGAHNFFTDGRSNIAEVAVNAITVGAVVARIVLGEPNVAVDLIRLVRVLRLQRAFQMFTGLRLVLDTVVASGPLCAAVFFLVSLVFFMYAVVGMLVFGGVRRGEGIDRYANFDRLDYALMTLLRVATYDNWQVVMWDCTVSPPNCDPNIGECGYNGWAQLYFFSFVLLGAWIGLNFFTAVMLDAFSRSEREDRMRVQYDHVKQFRRLWKKYSASDLIDAVCLQRFFAKLGPPLGPEVPQPHDPPDTPRVNITRFMAGLELTLMDNRAFQGDVFHALIAYYYAVPLPHGAQMRLKRMLSETFRRRLYADVRFGSGWPLRTVALVVRIQATWRAAVARRKHPTLARRPSQATSSLSAL